MIDVLFSVLNNKIPPSVFYDVVLFMGDEEVYYELYGEYVSLREFGVATLISTILALAFYFVSPHIASLVGVPATGLSITLGAVGASVGFAVSVFFTKVKRVIREV